MKHIQKYVMVMMLFCSYGQRAECRGDLLDANSQETLSIPPLSAGSPAPGKRVKVTPPEYAGTEVFHTVYLPETWKRGGPHLPIVFEYTGNYYPAAGSTGEPEDAGLGFGLSGGRFIWVSLPYISENHKDNAVTWWGDEIATVAYAKLNVPRIIKAYHADPNAVFLCGFSRGAIGVNYIGLHDDEIADLWTAFVTHDHFDGVRQWGGTEWGSPLKKYRAEALQRLQRVGSRPYLVSQNGRNRETEDYLGSLLADVSNFTFSHVHTEEALGAFPNAFARHEHNDRWLLTPSSYRSTTWTWMNSVMQQRAEGKRSNVLFPAVDELNGRVGHVIWQEAESFENTGTWSNDSQHMDNMGSPYLLATGVGRAVEDAHTEVEVPKSGTYTLWVRCRDWYPSRSPGRFQVLVGGKSSQAIFGKADSDDWQWLNGGSFDLKQGKLELRLHDTTGWWGRCDALILASSGFKPSNDPKELAAQRLEHVGVSPTIKDMGEYDLVVVGGGPAGIGAAVAAARHGIKVAFIQDRPVLGGNASSEIMIPPQDASITGIAEELYPVMAWEHFGDSDHALKMVTQEPNISLFLNTRATGVEMEDTQTITAVLALNVHTGQRLRFSAPLFADTTGHGWIGFYAGAKWRMGTEARTEFGESMAPVQANPYTMGNNLYRADFRDMGKPDRFDTPAWAYHFDSPDDFVRVLARTKKILRPEAYDQATKGPGRPVNATGPKRGGAFSWFVEYGGTMNIIDDAEKIRDDLFRLHMGLWGYVKNHDPRGMKENSHLRMVWLNYVTGTRESRRLMGDCLMTQRDYEEDLKHPDLVAFTRWGIDDHQPHGYFTRGIDAMHVLQGKYVGIPYRCLYSKNMTNLFMAGRCLSASHMAMAGVRVMRPMAATGQAVGTAAALATHHRTTPRGIYKQHIPELQQALLKDGCYIPGVRNQDLKDHALMAKTESYAIIDGWNQVVENLNQAVPWTDEPIELELLSLQTVACIHLSLTDRTHRVSFAVEALVAGQWQELIRSPGTSPQRRHVFNVKPVKTSKLRFRLINTSGPVAITEVRVYSEPGRETTLPLPAPVGFPPVLTD